MSARSQCPVCAGKGHVPAGFYTGEHSRGKAETCRSCGGRGTVVVEEATLAPAQPAATDLTYDPTPDGS